MQRSDGINFMRADQNGSLTMQAFVECRGGCGGFTSNPLRRDAPSRSGYCRNCEEKRPE